MVTDRPQRAAGAARTGRWRVASRRLAGPLSALLALAAGSASAQPVRLDLALAHPLLSSHGEQTTYLKVGLTGAAASSGPGRAPLNLAIVLDRSRSMGGEKLRQAKAAALMAVDRLDRRDRVAVVAYDENVQVVVPSTSAAHRQAIKAAIRQLQPGSSTALFAAVSKAAAEVRKYASPRHVGRIIVLSDGQANLGPSTPEALGLLGQALLKERISVTTLGLGLKYNEDLLVALARSSGGNHAFVRQASKLWRFFRLELSDAMSVEAQAVAVTVRCDAGVRPVRVLGHPSEVAGSVLRSNLSRVNRDQERYLLLQLQVTPRPAGTRTPLAQVDVRYVGIGSGKERRLSGSVAARFTTSRTTAQRATAREVMVAATEQLAIERNAYALDLRDRGQVRAAQRVLRQNVEFLRQADARYHAPRLQLLRLVNERDAQNLTQDKWPRRRKLMRFRQNMPQPPPELID